MELSRGEARLNAISRLGFLPMSHRFSPLAALAVVAGLDLGAPSLATAAEDGSMASDNNSFVSAATQPLDDLNLKGKAIPDVLRRATKNPYDVAGLEHCEGVAAEIARIDAALGPDRNEPPPPGHEDKPKGVIDIAHDAGVGAVRTQVNGLDPFRGFVRFFSGADKHQKKVEEAMKKGDLRRAYLKGYGMNMNCAPPAAPSWFKPKPAPGQPAEAGRGGDFFDWLRGVWYQLTLWVRTWWPF